MNVLISSLGESPAVVTETVDALEREERIKFERVVTIGTNGVGSIAHARHCRRSFAV